MRVPYSYLREQFADSESILRDIKGLLESTDFTLGAAVTQFEESFAQLCGTRHAIGVGTGTDALFLPLKALGVGPGDEVITAANTFIATAGAITAAGARPAFVDVGDDFNLDPAAVEPAITPRTKAILPFLYAGQPAKMASILEVAKGHGLPVVEDACQAIGATIGDRLVGTFGVTAGFSLHPLKNLNVWGDGGVIVTSSDALDGQLRLLRNHGLRNRDEVEVFGYNSRLDTLQAIVGNHLIKDVEAITTARIRNARALDVGLADLAGRVRIPPRDPGERHVFHLYMFEADDRDRLLTHLVSRGIEAKIHYPVPLHLQPSYRTWGLGPGAFPVAEAAAGRLVSLPLFPQLTEAEIAAVVSAVLEFHG